MPEKNNHSERNNRKKKSRSIIAGSIVAIIIAITPYIFYTYKSFPSSSSMDFYFFVYESKYQESVVTVMWFLMAKLVPLLLLVLWFFTCKHWWYHVILIPIAMFAFQIVSLVYEDRYLDEVEIYWLLPIMMVVIPFVYLIRVKLFDKHVLGIDLEGMEAELRLLKQKQGTDKKNVERDEIKEIAPQKASKEYRSLSEKIEYGLSTHNIEMKFKQFQNSLKSLLHL